MALTGKILDLGYTYLPLVELVCYVGLCLGRLHKEICLALLIQRRQEGQQARQEWVTKARGQRQEVGREEEQQR